MNFKMATVTYTREVTVRVVYPADLSASALEKLAEETIDELDCWDLPEWESAVGKPVEVIIAAEDCRLDPSKKWPPTPLPKLFRAKDILLVNDDRTTFVAPEDASWWICDEEQVRQEHRSEVSPDQLLMFTK